MEQQVEVAEAASERTVVVKLTDLYHSYRIGHGPQFNPGELVRVPEREAETLVAAGAAVRHAASDVEASQDGKAPAHPNRDKMVKQGATK